MGFLIQYLVKQSRLHGKGVFADQDIKVGAVIYDENKANYDILQNEDYKKMTEKEKEKIRLYCSFDKEKDVWKIPLDDAKYTNHSDNPNASFDKKTNLLTALKNIKIGEEILIDYREIDDLCKRGKFDFEIKEKLKTMQKFKSFDDFLFDSENVKMDKELREFTLTYMHDALFQVKSDDFFKEFTVTPYKNETLDKLKKVFNRIVDAVEENSVQKMYNVVIEAEQLDYKYGNVFSSKFSLITIPEISIHLTDDQKRLLETSENEFLLNEYSRLPKVTRDDILKELTDRAQLLCCVIEALFYYIRQVDKDSYYNGMSTEEILEDYESFVKKASKEVSFSYEGPSSDRENLTSLSAETKKVFWLCEKNLKKFIISATLSVKDLYAEENIGGTTGLKFSLSTPDSQSQIKDYNYFNTGELPKRIQMFYDKILKKS